MRNLEKFRVEIVQHGHETRRLTVPQIQDMISEGWNVAVQIGNSLKALQKLDANTLRNTNRIVAFRPVMGG